MKLTLAQIARWSAAELHPAAASEAAATGYSIDSRTLQPGDLFIAIQGERFDGHDFVATAFERGASAAIIARDRLASLSEAARQHPLLLVENPLSALQRLATLLRLAAVAQPPRKATRTPRAAKARRVDDKTRRGKLKSLRRNAVD